MFAKQTDPELIETIAHLNTLLDTTTDRDECAVISDQLIKLHTINTANKRDKVSGDTLATIAANLAGILIIVKHEQVNVIASKALGFVMKLK